MTLVHQFCIGPDRTCLVLHGEVDLSVREELHAILHRAVGLRRSVTEVDLKGVTFLDCAAIGVLVAANNTARRHGHRVAVNHPTGCVRLVLELANVLACLTAPSPAAPHPMLERS